MWIARIVNLSRIVCHEQLKGRVISENSHRNFAHLAQFAQLSLQRDNANYNEKAGLELVSDEDLLVEKLVRKFKVNVPAEVAEKLAKETVDLLKTEMEFMDQTS